MRSSVLTEENIFAPTFYNVLEYFKLLASVMRNYFPKRPSAAPFHTLSKVDDVPVGFVTLPLF